MLPASSCTVGAPPEGHGYLSWWNCSETDSRALHVLLSKLMRLGTQGTAKHYKPLGLVFCRKRETTGNRYVTCQAQMSIGRRNGTEGIRNSAWKAKASAMKGGVPLSCMWESVTREGIGLLI